MRSNVETRAASNRHTVLYPRAARPSVRGMLLEKAGSLVDLLQDTYLIAHLYWQTSTASKERVQGLGVLTGFGVPAPASEAK